MTIKTKLDQLSVTIADEAVLSAEIAQLQKRLECNKALRAECEKLIDSTAEKDPIMHRILVLRFIQGLTWEQVVAQMNGKSTVGTYKKMYSRWLKEVDKNA